MQPPTAATCCAVLLALSALKAAQALPTGAPLAACGNIRPRHAGLPPQTGPSPFELDVSAFGGSYIPGQSYTLTLSATGSEDFRGLLVQGRAVADDSPVGAFIPGDLTRESDCERADSAITHTDRSDKTSVSFQFTAPPAGTGPFRFQYAVVDRFAIFYVDLLSDPLDEEVVELEPLELSFTGDTPLVSGDDILANIAVSRPVPLSCELITRGLPQAPVFTDVQNCSSGSVTFLNVAGGEHRVRVIAEDETGERAVIRSRIIIMPDVPNFCSLNAINEGVTKTVDANSTVVSYTIQWNPIGNTTGFTCFVGNRPPQSCTSPFTFSAGTGPDRLTRVKVVPMRSGLEGCARRRPLVFLLN